MSRRRRRRRSRGERKKIRGRRVPSTRMTVKSAKVMRWGLRMKKKK